jgi:hypothetical protein
MKVAPFTVQLVERTITFIGEDQHEDEYDEGTVEPADLRAALDALNREYWDDIDLRGDGTIIAYPADMHQDIRTGVYESTQVIIKARRPEWADRLIALHEAGH